MLYKIVNVCVNLRSVVHTDVIITEIIPKYYINNNNNNNDKDKILLKNLY